LSVPIRPGRRKGVKLHEAGPFENIVESAPDGTSPPAPCKDNRADRQSASSHSPQLVKFRLPHVARVRQTCQDQIDEDCLGALHAEEPTEAIPVNLSGDITRPTSK
jgi:hypothetical protein